LGTRAVDRVSNDYPRMVALSHPDLRPEIGAAKIRRYSQRSIDLINLRENQFETRAVTDLLDMEFPSARLLVSVDRGDYLQSPPAYDPNLSPRDLILSFDALLTKTEFVPLMKGILHAISERFGRHVDIEFTADIMPSYPEPEFAIHLLQCRPQARREDSEAFQIPTTVAETDILFTADRLVPSGRVQRIQHIVFVDPEAYDHIPDETTRLQVARVVGSLNKLLEEKRFILMGPGRWGSANLELGVKVTYADIYRTAMLIEIGLSHGDSAPEVSYGTHFFQDLVEARIHPLALYPGQSGVVFNWRFFRESPNEMADLLPDAASYARYVRVIDVPAVAQGRFLEVIMDDEESKAMGYLRYYPKQRL
jgi:pyruvate,water dikinase